MVWTRLREERHEFSNGTSLIKGEGAEILSRAQHCSLGGRVGRHREQRKREDLHVVLYRCKREEYKWKARPVKDTAKAAWLVPVVYAAVPPRHELRK